MKIFGWNRKKTPSIEELIEGWTDVEILQNFMAFMGPVGISTEFIQNDVGFIVAEVLHIQCGDNVITSPPLQLDWPLEPIAFPEEHKEKLN